MYFLDSALVRTATLSLLARVTDIHDFLSFFSLLLTKLRKRAINSHHFLSYCVCLVHTGWLSFFFFFFFTVYFFFLIFSRWAYGNWFSLCIICINCVVVFGMVVRVCVRLCVCQRKRFSINILCC